IDFVTLLETLKREKAFDETTGKTYLMDLANNCPSISNVEIYANLIRDKYDVRKLITASREIIEEATENTSEPAALLDSAEEKIYDIRQGKDYKGLRRIDQVILETYTRLDILNSDSDDSLKPISTGIGDLDRTITGLNRSDLILLAARPGMGKTSFALNIAKNVACNSKKCVAFFSLEMTSEQLCSRLLSTEALVSGTKLRTGKLSEEEWLRLIAAGDVLRKSQIYLDDTPGITVSEIKAKLRRLRQVDLVIIDYLQLMSGARRTDNRVQEISEITRNLKILAKEMNVPVITLSQLSRASEQRQDHKPQLSDLRDSGSIEQDADIVLFLYREGYYEKDKAVDAPPTTDQNSGECMVAKNRHGETTSVKLHWQGEFMRFTSVEANREE
ncbi:MAG: replicative DNA helicase, partial [Oscillospiraceae bacterium]|nr:replicative DNA helicase [Oscillospiraceae bacterium]